MEIRFDEIVGGRPDGGAVPAAVTELRPDVVLTDVRLPLVDGVAATRRMTAEAGAPPVLALTAAMVFAVDHDLVTRDR